MSIIPWVCHRTDCTVSLASKLVQLTVSANGSMTVLAFRITYNLVVGYNAGLTRHISMFDQLQLLRTHMVTPPTGVFS